MLDIILSMFVAYLIIRTTESIFSMFGVPIFKLCGSNTTSEKDLKDRIDKQEDLIKGFIETFFKVEYDVMLAEFYSKAKVRAHKVGRSDFQELLSELLDDLRKRQEGK